MARFDLYGTTALIHRGRRAAQRARAGGGRAT
jgi:hypothetical protein